MTYLKLYTLEQIYKYIIKRYGIKMSYGTIKNHRKLGYLKPSAFFNFGKRQLYLYRKLDAANYMRRRTSLYSGGHISLSAVEGDLSKEDLDKLKKLEQEIKNITSQIYDGPDLKGQEFDDLSELDVQKKINGSYFKWSPEKEDWIPVGETWRDKKKAKQAENEV